MCETGPIYGVELIDELPLNYRVEGGWLQAMPSRKDLDSIGKRPNGHRIIAGYEVLLNHWREQAADIKRLEAEVERLQAIVDGYTVGSTIGNALMDKLIAIAHETKGRNPGPEVK